MLFEGCVGFWLSWCGVFGLLVGVAFGKPSTTHPFEITPGSFHMTASSYQAGAHPDWTFAWAFGHDAKGETFNDVRTVIINLPPGFIGNNTAVPTCSDEQLTEEICPAASAVGQVSFTVGGAEAEEDVFPIYNMEVNSFGVTAEFGFKALHTTSVIPATVRPVDLGITSTTPNIQDLGEVRDVSVKIWGLPASSDHDRERQLVCEAHACDDLHGGSLPSGIAVKPFLANPTSCGTHTASIRVDSWEAPENWLEASNEVGPVVECERVPFDPTIEAQPTTDSAESPSGMNVSLIVPQSWENPFSLATSHLKDATGYVASGLHGKPLRWVWSSRLYSAGVRA